MTDPVLFLLAVLTLLGTPGPTNTLLATSGALAGVRRSLPLLIGELAGYLLAIAAIWLILAPVFHAFPLLGAALKLAVAIYLVWTAVRLWRRTGTLTAAAQIVGVRAVFVTTLLNPKALIFALSIIPLASPAVAWFLVAFAIAVPSVGLCWIVLGRSIGALSGKAHSHLLPRIASVVLLGFAALVGASAFS